MHLADGPRGGWSRLSLIIGDSLSSPGLYNMKPSIPFANYTVFSILLWRVDEQEIGIYYRALH